MLAGKTAPPPAVLLGALPKPRPSTPWALQWSQPDHSLQYLMHFRYYGSNIGRFMKPDNVTGSPLNPQNWNLYSYVRGNPVNMNDPTGHEGTIGMMDPNIEGKLQSPVGASHFYDCGGGGAGGSKDKPPLTVILNVILDQNLSPEKQEEIKNKFIDTQLSDAQQVYGKAGINLEAVFSEGDVSGKNALSGNLSVYLSSDFAELSSRGTAGGGKISGNTGAIWLAMDRVSPGSFLSGSTFTHELGHPFGAYMNIPAMPKDAALEGMMHMGANLVADTYVDTKIAQLKALPEALAYLAGSYFRTQAKKWGE